MRVAAKEASPIPWKMSEADGQMITRYFSVCKEEVWRPSLVAFPRFQLYPSVVHKVPHSFRTTDMLTDAMKQLQDPSLFRTKVDSLKICVNFLLFILYNLKMKTNHAWYHCF
jgi:fanconi anemia group M protein